MSSNMRIEKVCDYCMQTYVAKMTTTRYCSHDCNRKHYKQLQREKKVQQASIKQIHNTPSTNIQPIPIEKPFLSMKEAAILIGVHERTVMKLVKDKILPSSRIGRRVIISNESLKSFIESKKA